MKTNDTMECPLCSVETETIKSERKHGATLLVCGQCGVDKNRSKQEILNPRGAKQR